MTEEQAKTRRCCGPEGCGAYPPTPPNYINEDGEEIAYIPSNERFCIGSACMAWQWTPVVAPPDDGFCGLTLSKSPPAVKLTGS